MMGGTYYDHLTNRYFDSIQDYYADIQSRHLKELIMQQQYGAGIMQSQFLMPAVVQAATRNDEHLLVLLCEE